MNRTEYDAVQALSFSGMKELLKSPAHYRHWLTAEREQTKAMLIGSATHSAVLTPSAFKDSYAQAPECDRRTKDGKAIWEAAQQALKPGQQVLAFDDFQQVMDIADAVTRATYEAGIELRDGDAEVPLVGKDRETPIKGIPDFISAADHFIYDLKTTSEGVTAGAALRTILNNRYHVQAAHYIRLAHCHRSDVEGFRVIMVEKDAPFSVAIYQVTGEVLEAGRKECERAYALYDQCVAEDKWPTLLERDGVVSLDTMPGSKSKASPATLSF